MRYFREYGRGQQLLLLMLIIFTFFITANIVIPWMLSGFYGINFTQLQDINLQTPLSVINIAILTQGVFSVLIFLIPAYLYAYFSHPNPSQYLGLIAPGKKIHFLLVILLMLGAMPVLQLLEGLIGKINFGESIRKSQQQNDDMMAAFMNMPTFMAFIKSFIVMAIVPGIGEEFFFRGIMMRFAKGNNKNMLFPILFTAVVFAFAHSNIYGFLSIFLAGTLLGFIYYLTGSLWCSILAHVFFNGSQIGLAYWGNTNTAVKQFTSGDSLMLYIPYAVAGAIIFAISLKLLLKNKTPLATDWPKDFTDEELSEKTY